MLPVLLHSKGKVVSYLLKDDFITTEGAPMASPRTCEPGPGALTLVQTDGQLSIVGGIVQIPAQATPGMTDLGFYTITYARQVGRFLYAKLSRSVTWSAASYPYVGWGIAAQNLPNSINNTELSLAFGSNAHIFTYRIGLAVTHEHFRPGINYECVLMLRSAGGFIFLRGNTFSTWELVGIIKVGTGADLRPVMNTYDNPASTIDTFYVGDFANPKYKSDYGIATSYVASPAAGQTATMEPDAMIEFTWQAATGETLEVDFRRTDDDNRWIVRCSQAGSNCKLIERVAGGESERFSFAQTFTNGSRYRILGTTKRILITVMIDDAVVYSSNIYRIGTFNASATGVKVSGFTTGSNLACYPLRVALPIQETGITHRIATLGDSKCEASTFTGWQPILLSSLGAGWAESYRMGIGGAGLTSFETWFTSDSARCPIIPEFVLVNIGVNSMGGGMGEATFKGRMEAILDAVHARWSSTTVLVAVPWMQGRDAESLNWASWIAEVIADGRSAWSSIGLDEYAVIRPPDNGVTNTTDGIHYSAAGNIVAAAAWQTAMGY